MLKAFLERRRLRKTFERYVSPKIARDLASSDFPWPDQPHILRDIEFAFIAVTTTDVQRFSEHISAVVELAHEHHCVTYSLLPCVVVAFGAITPISPGSRARFISAVQARLGSNASIIHGAIMAYTGKF